MTLLFSKREEDSLAHAHQTNTSMKTNISDKPRRKPRRKSRRQIFILCIVPGEPAQPAAPDPKKTLAQLAPLPTKEETSRKRPIRRGPPGAELTSEEGVKFANKVEEDQEKKKKKPALKKAESVPKKVPPKEDQRADMERKGLAGAYLGVGATKLMVMRGEKNFFCLTCSKPYKVEEKMTPMDRWVLCKSCNKSIHAYYLASKRKCFCGALALKYK